LVAGDTVHLARTSFALNSLCSWIKRALFHLKQIIGAPLDVLDRRISMRRLAGEAIPESSSPERRETGRAISLCCFP